MQISSNYPHAKSYTVMLKSQSSVKVEKTGLLGVLKISLQRVRNLPF